MKLIVGLGNPGREYVGTRHNIGFEVVDRFASRNGMTGSDDDFDRVSRTKFDGLALDGSVTVRQGSAATPSRAVSDRDASSRDVSPRNVSPDAARTEKVLLLKPTTFMNLSGRAVQAAMSFYQLTPSDIMVVLDDVALPCGKLRIRPGGSDGGHNGLKDIARALGTQQYPRLRIGVDAPPPRVPQRDYVLGRFTTVQRDQIDLDRAADALLMWIGKGLNAAMNEFNAENK